MTSPVAGINREYVASEKAPPHGQRHSESAKEEGKGEEIERRDSKRRSVAQLARDHNIFRVPGNRTWPRVSVRDLLKDPYSRGATLNAFLLHVLRSEFVVVVIVVVIRGERESLDDALGKTDRYPKCRLAGLRAGM